MAFKRVDRDHFEVFVSAREAAPEKDHVELKSYGYKVRRLYYRSRGMRVAYVQVRQSDGEITYHINGATA